MRLNNANPYKLVQETLIFRGQFWVVKMVDEEGLHLGKHHNADKGLLRIDQLDQCRLYPSHEQVAKTYPYLMRALRWACILSHGEASGAVQGYITTGPFYMGSEAVSHVGGSLAAIRHAIRCRHKVRQEYKRAFEEAKRLIAREIALTNNGKLLRANVPSHLRDWVARLLESGYLSLATFLRYGDAISLSS